MKSLQLKSGGTKMVAVKTFINLLSLKSASILFICACMGFLLGCSAEGTISGPEINISGDGFEPGDPNFTAEKTLADDVQVENHIRVNVEAINGEVVVTGQSGAQRVMVTANLSVSSDSQEDADLHLDDLDVLLTDDTDEILIQTVQPENIIGRRYRVEYDIIVPKSFEVVTSQTNGTVAIFDIQNSVDVSNENGDVLLSDIVGAVTADVANGTIEGTVVLPFNETIDLSVNNGNLELSIPTTTSAEFSATVNGIGEIVVFDLDITDALSTPQSLTGTIGNGDGSIVLSAVNGKIEVIGFD